MIVTATDYDATYAVQVSGVYNAAASQYTMTTNETIHIVSKLVDGTYRWMLIRPHTGGTLRYSAGADVMVSADGPGITASTAGTGNLTITVPENVTLFSFRFFGVSGDLSSGEITIDIVGGYGSGTDFNTSDSDMYHPVITVQQRTVAPSADFEQRPHTTTSFNIYDELFDTSGTVSVKVTGLSGSFGIFGTF